jgi:AcrR family transcriptional regulator
MVRVRTEAKRDAILETATEVFRERGLDGASMSEIAKRLGGSKATLYGYFPSKEELFVHVTLRVVARQIMPALQGMPERADEDPRKVIFDVGRQLIGVVTSRNSVTALRLAVAQGSVGNLGQVFYDAGPGKGIESFTAYLAAATRAGRLNVSDPVVGAHHLRFLLEAETFWSSTLDLKERKSQREIDQTIERAVDVFLAAYGPAATPSLLMKADPKRQRAPRPPHRQASAPRPRRS